MPINYKISQNGDSFLSSYTDTINYELQRLQKDAKNSSSHTNPLFHHCFKLTSIRRQKRYGVIRHTIWKAPQFIATRGGKTKRDTCLYLWRNCQMENPRDSLKFAKFWRPLANSMHGMALFICVSIAEWKLYTCACFSWYLFINARSSYICKINICTYRKELGLRVLAT